MSASTPGSVKHYIAIARLEHWFKNLMMLPGYVVALLLTDTSFTGTWPVLLLGMLATSLVASSNYVLNEWLDADYDQYHPSKNQRPTVYAQLSKKLVYAEYFGLALIGFLLGFLINPKVGILLMALWLQGIVYNVPPLRSKERAFIDIISESINNPIRLLLGWLIVISDVYPPSSILLSYWMGGAFLLTVKRYAEYRFIDDPVRAARYRRSFAFYDEHRLLLTSFFYGACCAVFFAVFMIKYRIELLLTLPFLAVLFLWYLYIGLKPNSPAQHPERMYVEKRFMIYTLLVFVLICVLLFQDIPWLHVLSDSAF